MRPCAGQYSSPAGGLKPITPSSDRNEAAASWRQGVSGCPSLKLSQQLRCNVGMSGVDHAKMGPVGSGSVTAESGVATISIHHGIAKPASANTCSQFLTDWKHGAGLRSMPSIMASAMVGWCFLTMLMLSAQLAHWAATLECQAPNPPRHNGSVEASATTSEHWWRSFRNHCHKPASCAANSSTKDGLRVLK